MTKKSNEEATGKRRIFLVDDHQLMTTQLWIFGIQPWIGRVTIGIDVNQLHDPIAVAAARGSEQMSDHLSGNGQIATKHVRLPAQ